MKNAAYASISWCVEDVIQNVTEAGIRVTRAQAERLLRKHETEIENAMVSAGWGVIEQALNQEL